MLQLELEGRAAAVALGLPEATELLSGSELL